MAAKLRVYIPRVCAALASAMKQSSSEGHEFRDLNRSRRKILLNVIITSRRKILHPEGGGNDDDTHSKNKL